jgi:putative transposase
MCPSAGAVALGQHRSTQRKIPRGREDEERLRSDIIELAGNTAATAIARLPDRCAERIWRRERLKVPHQQTAAGLWLTMDRASSCGQNIAITYRTH